MQTEAGFLFAQSNQQMNKQPEAGFLFAQPNQQMNKQ